MALRLPFVTTIAQDPDGARFARGLLRYDLTQGHPHPPGYPLFMALGGALHALGVGPARALSCVSAAALGALVALVARWTLPRVGTLATVAGAALLVLSPLATVLSTRGLSDLLGAALAWAALLSAARPTPDARRVAVLSALVLLARVSSAALCLPALALALAADRRRAPAALALFVGVVALGYAPVVVATGASRFVALALGHATGHFERFGGSVVTHPDLGARASTLLWSLWTHALGGPWPDRPAHLLVAGVGVSVALVASWRAPTTPDARPLLGCGAIYLAWVFFGQNVLWSPRHLLPLVPLLAIAFARGVTQLSLWWPRAAPALLVVGLASIGAESLRLSRLQRDQAPPTVAASRWLSAHVDPAHAAVASAQLGPWLRGLAPPIEVVDVTDARDVARLRAARTGAVFVTSEVRGSHELGGRVRARFVRDRYVTPALYDLALIELPR